MEKRGISWFNILCGVGILWVLACSTAPKQEGVITEQGSSKNEGTASESYGPQPAQNYPVILVFGPGMARGFAFAGVLLELKKAKIPISGIFGTEMGAWIGALYATSNTSNEFEWKLMRLSEDLFENSTSGFSWILKRKKSREKKLNQMLQAAFDDKKIQEIPIVLKIGVASDQGEFSLVDQGVLSTILRATMSDGESFDKIELNGSLSGSAGEVRPYPVQEAKKMGIGPVIAVDVLDEEMPAGSTGDSEKNLRGKMESARNIGQDELDLADIVIRPDLSRVGYTDFSKRSVAIFEGAAATQEQLSQIQYLVGLTQESSP